VIAWLLVLPCAAWVVVRAFGLDSGHPLTLLIVYTPLAVAGALAAAVVAALLRRGRAAVVALACAVALAAFVAPRALGGPSTAEGGSGPRLRVLTANVHVKPRAAEALVALARRTRADVVSVQEVNPEVARALERAGLGELLPGRVVEPRAAGLGSALYARAPLTKIAGVKDGWVAARARVGGGPAIEVHAVHPLPPLNAAAERRWSADMRALPSARRTGPVRILAGDFNATLDHAELRRLLDRRYEDAADAVGRGLRATWPADRRFPPPVTIDHVIADERCGVRSLRVFDLPGSDHRAVLAELELPRG